MGVCNRDDDEGWALDAVTKTRKGPEESGLPLIASVAPPELRDRAGCRPQPTGAKLTLVKTQR